MTIIHIGKKLTDVSSLQDSTHTHPHTPPTYTPMHMKNNSSSNNRCVIQFFPDVRPFVLLDPSIIIVHSKPVCDEGFQLYYQPPSSIFKCCAIRKCLKSKQQTERERCFPFHVFISIQPH